jgi:hypothetical protein
MIIRIIHTVIICGVIIGTGFALDYRLGLIAIDQQESYMIK